MMYGIAMLILLLNSWLVLAAEPIQIDLRTKAQVDGESILLGQIAEIRYDDSEQAEVLRNIEVGRAPLPGQSLFIYPSRVKLSLKQNNIDPGRCRIASAGPVNVLRNHSTVSAEQIRAAVTAFIKAHAPWSAAQMKIRPIRYSQSHIVPTGEVTLQVTAPKHTDWLGAIPFKVRVRVNGQAVKRTVVPSYIEVWQNVVLAAKPLGRNQPITQGDIRTQKMNMARVPANALLRPDEVVGRRANRSIAVNSILRSDQVETPLSIRKGDMVQVLAESSAIKITTLAQAQENGAVGERIRLLNMRSKKMIQAKIIDSQTVKVDFQ